MKDYRLKEHRAEYFKDLYLMNLEHRVMPGLVYLYMPELAAHYSWGAEQRLWFAVINGCTQNPITSLRIFNKSPEIPRMPAHWRELDEWFNAGLRCSSTPTASRTNATRLKPCIATANSPAQRGRRPRSGAAKRTRNAGTLRRRYLVLGG